VVSPTKVKCPQAVVLTNRSCLWHISLASRYFRTVAGSVSSNRDLTFCYVGGGRRGTRLDCKSDFFLSSISLWIEFYQRSVVVEANKRLTVLLGRGRKTSTNTRCAGFLVPLPRLLYKEAKPVFVGRGFADRFAVPPNERLNYVWNI
jgi:hypothetical protein